MRKGNNYVLDMNALNRKKAYHHVTFKTGGHMTVRDRPRKKDWLKKYSISIRIVMEWVFGILPHSSSVL